LIIYGSYHRGTPFWELANDFYAYRVASHQHTPEIEQALGESSCVLLTTQMLPVARGIYVSAYARMAVDISSAEIYRIYVNFYNDCPFVHVLEPGHVPHLKSVTASNHCHIGIHTDPRSGIIQVFSAIDNLQKGAAGQALQNANLMCGLAETAGLDAVAPWV